MMFIISVFVSKHMCITRRKIRKITKYAFYYYIYIIYKKNIKIKCMIKYDMLIILRLQPVFYTRNKYRCPKLSEWIECKGREVTGNQLKSGHVALPPEVLLVGGA